MPVKSATNVPGKQNPEIEGRSQAAGNWITRHLRKPIAKQGREAEDILVRPKVELERPKTAPSSDTAEWPYVTTQAPPLPPLNRPPPLPPRPNSGVVREVNAWLDASAISPAPCLMGGLPYWREGNLVHAAPRADVRYAVAIPPGSAAGRPPTHGQQFRSFVRRAGKMQVRMPALPRSKSQRSKVAQRRQMNRRSVTMPSIPPIPPLPPLPPLPADGKPELPEHKRPFQSRSLMELKKLFASDAGSGHSGNRVNTQATPQDNAPTPRLRSCASTRFDNQEAAMERRVNAVFGRTGTGSRIGTWRSSNSRRGESVLSDAPTYSSGVPPPSYHSRAESIRSTSSFGCVDAMNVSRQHTSSRSEETVSRNTGMKEKFKRFAQRARFSKREG